MLSAAIASVGDKSELEVPVFLAIELLRLDVLSAKPMFDYDGAPFRGSGKKLVIKSIMWQPCVNIRP